MANPLIDALDPHQLKQAQKLVDSAAQDDKETKGLLLPIVNDDHALMRLVIITPTTPASGEVVNPFRFGADPNTEGDLAKEIAILRPDELSKVKFPPEWEKALERVTRNPNINPQKTRKRK